MSGSELIRLSSSHELRDTSPRVTADASDTLRISHSFPSESRISSSGMLTVWRSSSICKSEDSKPARRHEQPRHTPRHRATRVRYDASSRRSVDSRSHIHHAYVVAVRIHPVQSGVLRNLPNRFAACDHVRLPVARTLSGESVCMRRSSPLSRERCTPSLLDDCTSSAVPQVPRSLRPWT